jgi:tetratricopeptide (TPR) repeat protein
MSKIFISYRRQDSRPVATLIYEPLARHFEAKFGAGAVFMDVHGIPLGVNFRSYLNEQVASAELLLALIADRWLTAVDEHGARRIDSPDDFVRIEIEAALKRGIPVVPVYVDDAKFLREEDLPGSLKDLAWMNGFQLRTDAHYFATDAAQLITGLEPHLAPPPPVADDKARAEKYVESGGEHYDKGDDDRAIADCDQAIRLNPKSAHTYAMRGHSYKKKGDYDRAIADFDRALAIDPNDPSFAARKRYAEQERPKQNKKKGWFG